MFYESLRLDASKTCLATANASRSWPSLRWAAEWRLDQTSTAPGLRLGEMRSWRFLSMMSMIDGEHAYHVLRILRPCLNVTRRSDFSSLLCESTEAPLHNYLALVDALCHHATIAACPLRNFIGASIQHAFVLPNPPKSSIPNHIICPTASLSSPSMERCSLQSSAMAVRLQRPTPRS
jgi:hypothetical protein